MRTHRNEAREQEEQLCCGTREIPVTQRESKESTGDMAADQKIQREQNSA